jgi:hypothetical protein
MGWLDDIIATAQDKAAEAFPGQKGYQDQSDSMRHMLATGQLAQKVGRYPALGLMAAHEVLGMDDLSANTLKDSAMDMRNNRIGAEIGATTESFTDLYARAKDQAQGAKVQKLGLKQAVLSGDPKNMRAVILKPPKDLSKLNAR